jgi:hypothetical protein
MLPWSGHFHGDQLHAKGVTINTVLAEVGVLETFNIEKYTLITSREGITIMARSWLQSDTLSKSNSRPRAERSSRRGLL